MIPQSRARPGAAKTGQGPGETPRAEVAKGKESNIKEAEVVSGKEETRGAAEEQQLPRTLPNTDWVFEQGGSKNLRAKSKQGHVSAAWLCGAGIPRGDGNRHER